MSKCVVFAMDKNKGFGYKGGLPWGRIPDDMERFATLTKQYKNVVMGVNTFKSLPSKLKERTNIVLARRVDDVIMASDGTKPDLILAAGLDFDVVDLSLFYKGIEEYAVIGGAKLIVEAVDSSLIDDVYMSVIDGEYKADVFMPDVNKDIEWGCTVQVEGVRFFSGKVIK